MLLFNKKKKQKKESKSKEFIEFMEKYLQEECEGEPFELVGLLGYNIGGAGKSSNRDFYSQHFTCIATLDNDKVIENKVKMVYFLDNTSPLQFLQVKDLTPYKFVVKKVKDKDFYCLIELNGISSTNLFDSIIEENCKQLSIQDGDDVFEYNRRFNEYTGKVIIGDKTIEVSLNAERDTTDATKSLETFKKIRSDFQNFYGKVLTNCAEEMTKLANSWREDGDTHEITKEEFKQRIDKDSFDLVIIDTSYMIYFGDDNMFWGHSIVYNGNIETNRYDATIAG